MFPSPAIANTIYDEIGFDYREAIINPNEILNVQRPVVKVKLDALMGLARQGQGTSMMSIPVHIVGTSS